MRIIAGTARGRRILAPLGQATRPTSDRVREATFNALSSLGALEGAEVLDLFAGSGALGLEALSRGAARVTFVERDPSVLLVLRSNLDTLGFTDRADVVRADALRYLAEAPRVDLALCDPPYDFDAWEELLAAKPAKLVVIESDRSVELPSGWRVIRQKRYGATVVTIASPDPPTSPE